jgi:hypothetical protein
VAVNGFTAGFGAAMALVGDAVNGPWGWVMWLWDVSKTGFTAGFKATLTLLGEAWDWIKRLWGGFTGSVTAAVNQVTGGGQNTGTSGAQTPTPFQAGGIVTSPTLALVGESGPEAVVPLSGGGGWGNVSITLNGNVYPDDIEDLIVKALDRARRRGRTV